MHLIAANLLSSTTGAFTKIAAVALTAAVVIGGIFALGHVIRAKFAALIVMVGALVLVAAILGNPAGFGSTLKTTANSLGF